MRFRKWHRFRLGKYTFAIYEKRTIHTGVGYRLGCGHNIVEICHALYKNGSEIWKRIVKYEVKLDN